MPNRFTLNLRPKYGPGEVPLGTQLGQGLGGGIGQAIEQYLAAKQGGRAERNQLALAGALPAGQGTQPPAPEDVAPGLDLNGAVDRVGRAAQGAVDQRMSLGQLLPGGATPPDRSPGGAPTIGSALGAGAAPATDTVGLPRGSTTLPPTAASNPITLEGPGGQRYVIDPLARERAQFGLKQQEEQATYNTGEQRTDAERQRKVGLLTPEYGAKAGEYEAFPELNPDRFRPYTGLTIGDRLSLEGAKAGQRGDLEAQRQQGRMSLQRLRAAGQVSAVQARTARAAGNGGAERQALQAQRATLASQAQLIPKYTPIDREMMAGDPDGQAQLDDADSERQRILGEMRTVEDRLRTLGGDTAAAPDGGAGTGGSKTRITQQQYDRAIAQGHTDAEINAHYLIDPTVRRRQ